MKKIIIICLALVTVSGYLFGQDDYRKVLRVYTDYMYDNESINFPADSINEMAVEKMLTTDGERDYLLLEKFNKDRISISTNHIDSIKIDSTDNLALDSISNTEFTLSDYSSETDYLPTMEWEADNWNVNYLIFRQDSAKPDSPIKLVGAENRGFQDGRYMSGHTYYYYVVLNGFPASQDIYENQVKIRIPENSYISYEEDFPTLDIRRLNSKFEAKMKIQPWGSQDDGVLYGKIYMKDTSGSGEWKELAILNGDFHDNDPIMIDFADLTPGATYQFATTCVGIAGETEIESYNIDNQYEYTVPELPETPTNVAAVYDSMNAEVMVSWDNSGSYYDIYRDTTPDMSHAKKIGSLNPGNYGYVGDTLSIMDEEVELGQTYYYRVLAEEPTDYTNTSFTQGLYSDYAMVELPGLGDFAITTPENFKATYDSLFGQISLSWDAAEGATNYRVYRSESLDERFSPITHTGTSETYMNDTDFSVGDNTFYYTLLATNSADTSAYPDTIEVSFEYLPPAPTGISIEFDGEWTRNELSWNDVDIAHSYNVYRNDSIDGQYNLIIEEIDRTAGIYDRDIEENKDYYYKVSSVYGVTEGPLSDPVEGSSTMASLLDPPTGITVEDTDEGVLVSWDPVEGASGYQLYRRNMDLDNFPDYDPDATYKTSTSRLDTDVKDGEEYFYSVATLNSDQKEGEKSERHGIVVGGTTNPNLQPPQISLTYNNLGSIYVMIQWTEANEASEYEVYKAYSRDGSYTKVGTTSNTSYTYNVDTNADWNETLYFKVISVDSAGRKSGDSNIESQKIN